MDFSAYLVHSGDEGLLEKLFIYQAFNQKTKRMEENSIVRSLSSPLPKSGSNKVSRLFKANLSKINKFCIIFVNISF